MLSVVIKNAILIILIILIVHFLLKGVIAERSQPTLIVSKPTVTSPVVAPESEQKSEIIQEPMTDEIFSYVYGGPAEPKITEPTDPDGTGFHAVIKEYTDEKPLNGGNLFNGLSAYDTDFNAYAPLA